MSSQWHGTVQYQIAQNSCSGRRLRRLEGDEALYLQESESGFADRGCVGSLCASPSVPLRRLRPSAIWTRKASQIYNALQARCSTHFGAAYRRWSITPTATRWAIHRTRTWAHRTTTASAGAQHPKYRVRKPGLRRAPPLRRELHLGSSDSAQTSSLPRTSTALRISDRQLATVRHCDAFLGHLVYGDRRKRQLCELGRPTAAGLCARVRSSNGKPCVPGTFFNTCAFTDPQPGSFGNVSLNSLRGPGYKNWDGSLLKNFPDRREPPRRISR